jgi:hypothetical protein
MNLKRLINKVLENKNFYYVIVALTLLHFMIYVYRGYYKSMAFFALSSVIIYNFTKKPVLVLLLSLIATHFFVASRNIYEGLENKDDEKMKNEENIDKLQSTDPELANAANKVSKGNMELNDNTKKNTTNKVSSIKDINNPDLNKPTVTDDEPVPESFEGGKKGTVRLDHAATVETAYDDLQNILGSDGIGKLTEDTKKLMSQQKNLYNVMNQLAPAVKETMGMLKDLDLNKITDMSNSTSSMTKQLQSLMSSNNVKAANDKSNK